MPENGPAAHDAGQSATKAPRGTKDALSPRQAAILSHIRLHFHVFGTPPSMRELMGPSKTKSVSTISYNLDKLAEWGYIALMPGVSRGIRLLRRFEASVDRDGTTAVQSTAREAAVLRERLAALEHEQWAHWTKYMLEHMNDQNTLRWLKQIETPYEALTEGEKEADRKWADKILALLA